MYLIITIKCKNSFLKSLLLKTVYLADMCSEKTLSLEMEGLGSDPVSAYQLCDVAEKTIPL